MVTVSGICRHTHDISVSNPRQLSLLMCCDTAALTVHTVSYSSDNPEPSSVSTGHLCQRKKDPLLLQLSYHN